MTLDIHDYDAKAVGAEQQIRASEISDHNKALILGFRDACLLKGVCGRVRLIRVLGALLLFARHVKKDFDQLTRTDVEALISALLQRQPPYSPETMGTYKAMIKSFLTWVVQPNEFPTKTAPPIVAWITSHVRRKDKRRIERKDLLTPQDIDKLLDVCHNTRDKALIAVLWETGARVAEVGNLQLKHITRQERGYTLDVTGKTGQRSPLIISSAPYLTQWINNHPFKDHPEAPLWVHYQYATTPKQLKYDMIRHQLAAYFKRAGINKPYHPHIFRHSRATFVLANGIMNEQQSKAYFGWSPSSDMLSVYSHLIDADSNNAILRENNCATALERPKELVPVECHICHDLNQAKADYCNRCGAVLDLAKAYEHQTIYQEKDEVVLRLVQLLTEKGLVDEAVETLHNAGLGATLKRLVDHQATTPTTRQVPPLPPGPPAPASPRPTPTQSADTVPSPLAPPTPTTSAPTEQVPSTGSRARTTRNTVSTKTVAASPAAETETAAPAPSPSFAETAPARVVPAKASLLAVPNRPPARPAAPAEIPDPRSTLVSP